MGVNLGTVDRLVRGAVGAALVVVGTVAGGAIGVVFALLGALLIFSGAVGFCHVYKVLGIRSCKRP